MSGCFGKWPGTRKSGRCEGAGRHGNTLHAGNKAPAGFVSEISFVASTCSVPCTARTELRTRCATCEKQDSSPRCRTSSCCCFEGVPSAATPTRQSHVHGMRSRKKERDGHCSGRNGRQVGRAQFGQALLPTPKKAIGHHREGAGANR